MFYDINSSLCVEYNEKKSKKQYIKLPELYSMK